MKCQFNTVLVLGGALFFLCSCASTGSNFHTDLNSLKLGRLKISESTQLFGNPNGKQDKITADGEFEILTYQYLKASWGTVSARYMCLEFKNGLLNAYEFVSSFDQDQTKFDYQSVHRLRAGIGKMSRSDVVEILGEPTGKALCPSMLVDYKDKCTKDTEIWAWLMFAKVKVGFSDHSDVKTADIFVTFDTSGMVTNVQSEMNDGQIYHK